MNTSRTVKAKSRVRAHQGTKGLSRTAHCVKGVPGLNRNRKRNAFPGLCRAGTIDLPGGISVPVPADVDVDALSTQVDALAGQASELGGQAKEYLNSIDTSYVEGELTEGLGVLKNVAGDAYTELNTSVIQPYWKETAPQLEAYFRNWWGDYYYDYFIDEWNSGVNDLNRLYNFIDTQIVAGDVKRLVALLVATWYTPGFLGFLGGLNKGYRGDVNAVDAFQMVEADDANIVDVRSDSEKNVGVPDLPNRYRDHYLDVGFARDWLTPDVMRLSKDSKELECKATSTVIADLKRLSNKGQPVIVLDSRNDGRAVMISKALTSTHKFKNVYVISGGFNSWKQNKLPSTLPAGSQRGGSRWIF